MEDTEFKFGFKEAVLIVAARDINQVPAEFNNVILLYPSITQAMVDSHCEIMRYNESVAGSGHHPTADYGAAEDDTAKQKIISQQRLSFKMLGLWIKNSLATDAKCNLSTYKISYTYYNQDNRTAMLFSIIKMVRPDICTEFSDIKKNL